MFFLFLPLLFVHIRAASISEIESPQIINVLSADATSEPIPFRVAGDFATLRVIASSWDKNIVSDSDLNICCKEILGADYIDCFITVRAKCKINNSGERECVEGSTYIQVYVFDMCGPDLVNQCSSGPWGIETCVGIGTDSDSRFQIATKRMCNEENCGTCEGCMHCQTGQCYPITSPCPSNTKNCAFKGPEAPSSILSIYLKALGTIQVLWGHPPDPLNEILGFDLSIRSSSEVETTVWIGDPTTSSYLFSSTSIGTAYSFRVRAIAKLFGRWSQWTTPIVPPDECYLTTIDIVQPTQASCLSEVLVNLKPPNPIPAGDIELFCHFAKDGNWNLTNNSITSGVYIDSFQLACLIPPGFKPGDQLQISIWSKSIGWPSSTNCMTKATNNPFVEVVLGAPFIKLGCSELSLNPTSTARCDFTVEDPNFGFDSNDIRISLESSNNDILPVNNLEVSSSAIIDGKVHKILQISTTSTIGDVTITVSASNSIAKASKSFDVFIRYLPVVTKNIPDMLMCKDGKVVNIPFSFSCKSFTQSELETLITITVESSNPLVVDGAGISIAGYGGDRRISIQAAGGVGNAVITIRLLYQQGESKLSFNVLTKDTSAYQSVGDYSVPVGCGICYDSSQCGHGFCSNRTCTCKTGYGCPYCEHDSASLVWATPPTCFFSPVPTVGGGDCRSSSDCNNGAGGKCINGKCSCFPGWCCARCDAKSSEVANGYDDCPVTAFSNHASSIAYSNALFLLFLVIMMRVILA